MSSIAAAPTDQVLVVERDAAAGALLVRYLETHGWHAELVTDPRRAVRKWAHAGYAPVVFVQLCDDDPDAFELLGALSGHAGEARVVVCARKELDLRALGVDRVLSGHCSFSGIASALADVREGWVVPEAAE